MEGARRAVKRTQSREELWRGPGGQPNALRTGKSGGSQTHSEPGGVVEEARRAAKRNQSREEWWSGPGRQPNALRAGKSGGGLHHYDIITVSEPQSVHRLFHR